MKIEVGGKYELSNGDIVECVGGPDVDGDLTMSNGHYYKYDGRYLGRDETFCLSVKRRIDTPETGTLKELNVKAGDVVQDANGSVAKVVMHKGQVCVLYDHWSEPEERNDHSGYRIISRASDTPKKWREMTDAEKGALLLDWNDNHARNVQQWNGSEWVPMATGRFGRVTAYRIRPEPVRDVVSAGGHVFNNEWHFRTNKDVRHTHRITFETVDGKPDCATIKMDEL